jgi:Tfp pilus assembly protein PilO
MQNKTITIIILLAIGLSLFAGIIWPNFEKYQRENLKVGMKKQELEYQKDYFSRLKEIDSRMIGYEEALSKIEISFPDYFSIPEFFSNIQRIASQSGLVVGSLSESSVGNTKEKGNIKKRVFSLALSGSYQGFKNFISSVENSSKLIEIESFDFSEIEEGTNNFKLTISTHSY